MLMKLLILKVLKLLKAKEYKEISINDMEVKKGDLFLKLNILFPETISPERKRKNH